LTVILPLVRRRERPEAAQARAGARLAEVA
jgi:hypothetical protein